MTPKNWETPICTICRTTKYQKVFYSDVTSWEFPGVFTFVQCQNCGLIFQSPRAPFSQVGKYYHADNYWGWDTLSSGDSSNTLASAEQNYHEMYDQIFSRYPQPASILDIGTGTGLFLTKFKAAGWSVQGTEISTAAAKYAQQTLGIPVKVGEISTMKLPLKSYDVIVLSGVLEHVYNPHETLQKCHTLLKDDGLLVALVPNILSLGHTILAKEWYHLQPGKHLYHFSPTTLKHLVQLTGFKTEKLVLSNWTHDHYSLFHNFRYFLSPKFKKNTTTGGLAQGTVQDLAVPRPFSVVKEIGKFVFRLFAWIGAILARVLGRGEVMVIYARKSI